MSFAVLFSIAIPVPLIKKAASKYELVRRVLPKGKSFDDLQQEDIDLMLSHINSYKRGKLNSRSAYQLFNFIYGDDILPKLNIREIEANDIVLSPKLLKK